MERRPWSAGVPAGHVAPRAAPDLPRKTSIRTQVSGRVTLRVVFVAGGDACAPSALRERYSATTQMLSEWLLNSGAYMHWMPAKPV